MLEGALTMNTVGEAGSKSQLREIPWESLKKKKTVRMICEKLGGKPENSYLFYLDGR